MSRKAGRAVVAAVRAVCLVLLIHMASCSGERAYDVQGRIAGFGDGQTIIVEHGEIRGLMPAMTMPFDVHADVNLDTLYTGDAVAFTLHIRGDSTWIDRIRKLPDDALPQHPAGNRDDHAPNAPELLDIGDPVPGFTLLTHADTALTLPQLEGTPVILTFIYTRCPLPDYCPRMTENFVRLQERIRDEQLGPVHLVSVSIDPSYDTPSVLREYADRLQADLSTWTFGTGDSTAVASLAQRFGVYYQTQSGEIVHNLSTALVGSDTKILRIWRGNEWTVEQILEALRQAQSASLQM